jgi:8-oxo-dGTP diphosphatase
MQAATLVYIQKDNKTLMLHRVKKQQDIHEGKWNGLWGKLEQGESPEECVRREIKEEVGLDVVHMQFKWLLTAPMFDGKQDWIIYVYVVDRFSGECTECTEGNVAWIENDRLLELNLRAWDREFIPLLFEPGRFSCKATYVDKELVENHINRYL